MELAQYSWQDRKKDHWELRKDGLSRHGMSYGNVHTFLLNKQQMLDKAGSDVMVYVIA